MNQCHIDLNQDNMIAAFSSPQFYGDTEVYIRELLQNAFDACNTRAALEWSWGTEFLEIEEARAINSMREPYHARIRISYNSLTQRLTIEDNGIGMNSGDIEKYVAKIGCSYYQSEDFAIQKLQYEPVARYGVGMLSCFMAARAILIESKKDKCVNTAWNITNKESFCTSSTPIRINRICELQQGGIRFQDYLGFKTEIWDAPDDAGTDWGNP